jgi:N-hydroxyarylamine O-acetyltransferase
MLAAEVANAEGVFGPPFDHMTLLVSLAQRWLVDVGFGDSFREPLLLDERNEQRQGTLAYRIDTDGASFTLLQRGVAGKSEWKPQYRFTLAPHEYADYEAMCRYHQTSPESHFTRGRICSLATAEGRISVSDMRLISTARDGKRQEQTLTSLDQYNSILADRFGIVIKN